MLNPILNRAITTLKESATLAINETAKRLRREGEPIVHFGFGQSPFAVHKSLQEALKAASFHKEYLPTLGLLELREAICQFYKTYYHYDFSPNCVLIGPGSKELIFQTLFVLEGPLLIPAPSWVSYGPQAHIRGKEVVPIRTKKQNGYKLTSTELQEACQAQDVSRQKILIINSPNNPTGAVYSESELKALSAVCREEGVIVISDEIYSLVNFEDPFLPGFAAHYPEGTIITSGLSKGHSAGGYRLGFLAVPQNMEGVIRALGALVSETFSAVSAPTQYAAIAAFQGDKEELEYVRQCTRIHKACGMYLYQRLIQMGAGCLPPQGAFYLFPDFHRFGKKLRARHIHTAKDFCNRLLKEKGVATLPADDFYCLEDVIACRIATVDYDGPAVFQASLGYSSLGNPFVEEHCPNLKIGADRLNAFLHS